MSWRQWLVLLGLFLFYLLFGGVVFMLIEAPEEELRLKELKSIKDVIYGLLQLWYIFIRLLIIASNFIVWLFALNLDKLITCNKNATHVDLKEREGLWIQIAEQINQPALTNSHSNPPKKWTLYNSFFVAVTVASTIGNFCSLVFIFAKMPEKIKTSNYTHNRNQERMRPTALLKRQSS